jgi:hypothetical protein
MTNTTLTNVVTPEQLIASFGRETARNDEKGYTVHKGFCGYSGGGGDLLETGFDDGYFFMGYLEDHGWRGIAEKGDWPYIVYLRWSHDGVEAIASYVEGDFKCWVFDNFAAAKALYDSLEDCP